MVRVLQTSDRMRYLPNFKPSATSASYEEVQDNDGWKAGGQNEADVMNTYFSYLRADSVEPRTPFRQGVSVRGPTQRHCVCVPPASALRRVARQQTPQKCVLHCAVYPVRAQGTVSSGVRCRHGQNDPDLSLS